MIIRILTALLLIGGTALATSIVTGSTQPIGVTKRAIIKDSLDHYLKEQARHAPAPTALPRMVANAAITARILETAEKTRIAGLKT
jgi:hypothetical protein